MASRNEAREYKARGKPYHKNMRFAALSCFLFLHFMVLVSFRATIVRSGMANRSVKDCRVGRKSCALLAMTSLVGFAGKRNNFRNETFEKRCGATPCKKRPHKTKNVRFPNKNVPILCHCEAATRPWQSLSQRHGIPHRSTGARNKKESLSQKTWIRRFIPRPLSSFQGSVSFRATIVRSGMTNRFVKDCRVSPPTARRPAWRR